MRYTALLLASLILTACGGEDQTSVNDASTSPTTSGAATPEASATTTTQSSATSTTVEPSTTTTMPPTTTISDEQLEKAQSVGDIEAGEELFYMQMEGIAHDSSCAACHSLDGADSPFGPTLLGISTVAAERIEGMTDVEYLRQSLQDPLAFKPEGWAARSMPYQYGDILTEEQVNNLVAFLLTR